MDNQKEEKREIQNISHTRNSGGRINGDYLWVLSNIGDPSNRHKQNLGINKIFIKSMWIFVDC